LAGKAGVNTILGFSDMVRDSEHATEIANKLGYPVMLTATGGVGGMRITRGADDVEIDDYRRP